MPTVALRLEPWSDLNRTEFIVEIDPTTVTALASDDGCVLQVPLKITPQGLVTTGPALLAAHGTASFSHNETRAGVVVPMQSLPINNQILRIPLSTVDLARIDSRRGSGSVVCAVNLDGLANIPFRPYPDYAGQVQAVVTVPVHSNMAATITIERGQWLTILKNADYDSRRLVELPGLVGPAGPIWKTCNSLLERATAQLRAGEAEPAIATSRQVLEGLVTVVAKHWRVTREPGQTMGNWLKELSGRLTDEWPAEKDSARVLTSLYAALWSWTSESHHYGSKVPLHQEAAFAVGLTAELLSHAGHLMAAHLEPLKSLSAGPAPNADGSPSRT